MGPGRRPHTCEIPALKRYCVIVRTSPDHVSSEQVHRSKLSIIIIIIIIILYYAIQRQPDDNNNIILDSLIVFTFNTIFFITKNCNKIDKRKIRLNRKHK